MIGMGLDTGTLEADDVSYRDLDLSWVTTQLALGGCLPLEAAAHLARRLGIRNVVDLRIEQKDDEAVLRAHGISFLHLPTRDQGAVALEALDHGVSWVRALLEAGERVYIHCQYGIGRSALLTCCVLVSLGHGPLQALALAKEARRKVSPSPEQLEAFRAWCESWRSGREVSWEVPSFQELAEIAYSHLHAGADSD